MKAALLKCPNQIELINYSLPKIKPDELLIKVDTCGLCGTDYHIFRGEAKSKIPVIPGHEYTGTVIEKGTAVSEFQIDDHVVIDPNISCGNCFYCRTGKIQFCTNLKALGVTQNGGFAEYSAVPSSQTYLIPKNLSFRVAAFTEPLSCCVHGIDQAAIKHGESVVIIGAGTIGLLMLQLASLGGSGKVIIVEPVESKRNLAMKLGADFCLDPDSQNITEEIQSLTSGGADVVIECAGSPVTVALSLQLLKRGGRVVIFGLAPKNESVNVNLQDFFLKELTIKGSLLNPFTFSRAIELLASNKINVEVFNPVQAKLEDLKDLLSQPKNLSVTKYQITLN